MPTDRSQLMRRAVDRLTRPLPALERGDGGAAPCARRVAAPAQLVPMLQIDGTPPEARTPAAQSHAPSRHGPRSWTCSCLLIDELHGSRREHREAARAAWRSPRRARRDEARKRWFRRLPIADLWRIAKKLERLAGRSGRPRGADATSAARAWQARTSTSASRGGRPV